MAKNLFERKNASDSEITELTDVSAETAKAGSSGVDINHRRVSRIGWLVLALGFGGFMLWAALAPLDQGVPASGQVVVTGNRKTVQNLGPGMVEAILVKDGDEVSKGDVLLRLDSTTARSQHQVTHSQWLVAKATEARLLADVAGEAEIVFPDELLKSRDDPRGAARWPCRRSFYVRGRRDCKPNWVRCRICWRACNRTPRDSRRRGTRKSNSRACCMKN
jgi:hypothetical protein